MSAFSHYSQPQVFVFEKKHRLADLQFPLELEVVETLDCFGREEMFSPQLPLQLHPEATLSALEPSPLAPVQP